jgi:hypothetical protein
MSETTVGSMNSEAWSLPPPKTMRPFVLASKPVTLRIDDPTHFMLRPGISLVEFLCYVLQCLNKLIFYTLLNQSIIGRDACLSSTCELPPCNTFGC